MTLFTFVCQKVEHQSNTSHGIISRQTIIILFIIFVDFFEPLFYMAGAKEMWDELSF